MSSRSLSRPQREKLQQFCSVTSAPQKIAIDALQASDWRVEAAVDYYYSSGMSAAAERATQRLDKNAIKAVFEKYKDPNANAIMVSSQSVLSLFSCPLCILYVLSTLWTDFVGLKHENMMKKKKN
jgi:hypothetical protein